jgi:hypothetical protein
MAALTDQLARLIGTFHGKSPRIQSVAVWRGYIKKAPARVNRMGRLGRPQGAAYRVLFRRRIPLKTLFATDFLIEQGVILALNDRLDRLIRGMQGTGDCSRVRPTKTASRRLL